MKFSHIVCTFVLFCAVAASAETVRFRSGEILAAELSREKPEGVHNADKLDLSELPDRRIYAALTVALDPGRKISIYDYSLKAFGVVSRCIALRNGSNSIDGARYETGGSDRENRCTLYFVLNAREVGIGSREKLTLVCNVPPVQELAVPFVNRGSKAFTPPRSIPDSGTMTDDK